MMCELKVITRAAMAEHHAIKSIVILERTEHLKPESIAIETHHFRKSVRGARDPEMS